jgi:ribulose-5-phosphate 4-epimerase/fuculose-1-phosphate aldolase
MLMDTNAYPTDVSSISPEEARVRMDLAACYRLIALYGWDDLVFTHISARVPGHPHHFLINPYGMLFEEISASALLKVDHSGQKVVDSPYQANPAGFNIHSAIHEARPEVNCVLHLHTPAGVAVSAQAEGLLPLSQQSIFPLASISYHDYEGLVLNEEERPRLVRDLGSSNFMILRNHGLLVCGPSIPDAFLSMYTLQRACEIQIQAQAGGGKLVSVPDRIIEGAGMMARKNLLNLGGMLAWPGLLRKLDRMDDSYRL